MPMPSDAMSVWTIISLFHPIVGGSEVAAQRLSRKLMTDYGWRVKILTRRHGIHCHGLSARDMIEGLPVTRVWSRGRFVGSLLYLSGGLWHLWRFGRGGIYHAHDIAVSSWLAVIARFLFGGRAVIKLRTGCYRYERLFSSFFPFSRLLSYWYFVIPLRLADCIVVVNNEVKQFVTKLGIPADRVVCIPNVVDTAVFHPASAQGKATMRQKTELPADRTIFLYVGRLTAVKGADTLLEAWQRLGENVRDKAVLVLVGANSDKEALPSNLPAPDVCDSIRFVGPRQNVRDYYWAADAFVLASRTEGMSNALLEAMACGLPVIASRVGGSLDLIQDGENGFLFEPENEEQLARKIGLVMDRRDQWGEIGIRARQTVVYNADINVGARRMNELYKQLL